MLPVHGFVLAGGKSLRMGQDKTLLRFRDTPLVEIAVEKLRSFCAEVSLAGNRDDLSLFAPVVRESRVNAGPAAGVEAGLQASGQACAIFMPVDVPFVPAWLLHDWAQDVMKRSVTSPTGSYLLVDGKPQPAFCILMKKSQPVWSEMLDRGERRLESILTRKNVAEPVEVAKYVPHATSLLLKYWFRNVNTLEELAEAESAAKID